MLHNLKKGLKYTFMNPTFVIILSIYLFLSFFVLSSLMESLSLSISPQSKNPFFYETQGFITYLVGEDSTKISEKLEEIELMLGEGVLTSFDAFYGSIKMTVFLGNTSLLPKEMQVADEIALFIPHNFSGKVPDELPVSIDENMATYYFSNEDLYVYQMEMFLDTETIYLIDKRNKLDHWKGISEEALFRMLTENARISIAEEHLIEKFLKQTEGSFLDIRKRRKPLDLEVRFIQEFALPMMAVSLLSHLILQGLILNGIIKSISYALFIHKTCGATDLDIFIQGGCILIIPYMISLSLNSVILLVLTHHPNILLRSFFYHLVLSMVSLTYLIIVLRRSEQELLSERRGKVV